MLGDGGGGLFQLGGQEWEDTDLCFPLLCTLSSLDGDFLNQFLLGNYQWLRIVFCQDSPPHL